MGVVLIISILVGVVSLAVLVVQAFLHSKYTGLIALSWVLLSSLLGTTYQFKESAVWLVLASIFVILVAANVIQVLLVVFKNIRRPSLFVPGTLLVLSSGIIVSLVVNGGGHA
ncbi:hypothetical protein [Microbulbifer taiwanensis]|uniref:Uncharacterized protein n=1 Tax=Microbulbifer taiwanensis TaxID=986746 RepID=A0ABW1YSB8_9GAMM|nr:hypothetical protein [Microbulbifer taiwanensis]